MSLPFRLPTRAWLLVPLGAIAFLLWIQAGAVAHVRALTGTGDQPSAFDPASPTGYRGGVRDLIVPNHDPDSYQWIAQTQQTLTRHEWRIRHVDYDNAPFGREVLTPSPYRWWFAFVAGCDHLLTGRSLGLAAEHTALFVDGAIQVLLLIAASLLVARWFGPLAAALQAIGLVLLFPLSDAFLAGAPKDHGLALMAAWSSGLPLLIGWRTRRKGDAVAERNALRWFAAGGIAGGIALWLSPATELALIVGTAMGALLAAVVARSPTTKSAAPAAVTAIAGNRSNARGPAESPAPMPHGADGSAPGQYAKLWLWWAAAGAASTLVCYLFEFFPDDMAGWHLQFIHPLWGLAWLGLGVLLAWATGALQSGRPQLGWRSVLGLVLAVVAIAGPVFLVLRRDAPALITPLSLHPPLLPGSLSSESMVAWIAREGVGLAAFSVLLPLLLLVPATWRLVRQRDHDATTLVALATGPVLVLLVLAVMHLYWWSALEIALLLLLVAAASASGDGMTRLGGASHQGRPAVLYGSWIAGVVLALLPGGCLIVKKATADQSFTEADIIALVERDVAHWLANRVGPEGAVVLAPPALTTSLYFHGGLRGLGTPYWENKDGIEGAIRIAGASSPDEGLAVAQKRQLSYIVLPSWDSALDKFVRATSNQAQHSILALLQQMRPPRWLRPVPYQMPNIPGFEGRSILVFQVVEVQDNATALSRLAEYFIEMNRMNEAMAVGVTLERSFPNDLGACVARVEVADAVHDPDQLAAALRAVARESTAGERSLPWDQRVSLAIAFAEGKQYDRVRAVLQGCLADVNEAGLRFLTPTALYRFERLCKLNRLEIPDPKLRELSRQLLPPELRDRV